MASVPSVGRKRSRSCATARPVSSMASLIMSRDSNSCRNPVASTRPSGEERSTRVTISALSCRLRCRLTTSSSMPGGRILRRCSVIARSTIRATVAIEARIRNQMGQPAAWMMENKGTHSGRGRTFAGRERRDCRFFCLGSASVARNLQRPVQRPVDNSVGSCIPSRNYRCRRRKGAKAGFGGYTEIPLSFNMLAMGEGAAPGARPAPAIYRKRWLLCG